MPFKVRVKINFLFFQINFSNQNLHHSVKRITIKFIYFVLLYFKLPSLIIIISIIYLLILNFKLYLQD